ncbi:MAG: LytR C-terminal domain-containing protein [Myxococcaceae bacterium]|nr:LytR C-terminal domain-containing protein [Myxococcaceae bacterium]
MRQFLSWWFPVVLMAGPSASAAELRIEEMGGVRVVWTKDSRALMVEDDNGRFRIGARSGRIERTTDELPDRAPSPAPDGVSADVEVTPTTLTGAWKDNTWTPPRVSTLNYFTRSPAGRFRSIETRASVGTLFIRWAPDGKRLAWVMRKTALEDHGFEGPGIIVIGAVGPRVQVLAEKSKLDLAVARVGDLLDRVGFPMTQVGPLLKPRASTVIYFAPEAEQAARTIAEAISGATVEPLTWDAHADLVVAVATSTLGALK